jgi:hypothetical protein
MQMEGDNKQASLARTVDELKFKVVARRIPHQPVTPAPGRRIQATIPWAQVLQLEKKLEVLHATDAQALRLMAPSIAASAVAAVGLSSIL